MTSTMARTTDTGSADTADTAEIALKSLGIGEQLDTDRNPVVGGLLVSAGVFAAIAAAYTGASFLSEILFGF